MVNTLLLGMIVLAFIAYAVLGGADFGAGIWEINHRLRTSEKDRKLIYKAIGPVWEANHVWLIFGLTAVWTCYPNEFSQLCNVSSVLLAAALTGIVLRGASYAFRAGGQSSRRYWEALFAFSSTLTPFCFGCLAGMLSYDRLPRYGDPEAVVERNPLTDWINFPCLFMGFFAVGICSWLASVFLAREAAATGDKELEDRWRSNALFMSWLVGAFSIVGLLVTMFCFATVFHGMVPGGARSLIVIMGVICGICTIVALQRQKYWMASVTSASTIGFVLLAWVLAQLKSGHGFGITIEAPDPATDNVRWLLFWCMVGGMILVLPAMIWLFQIFKSENKSESLGT